MLREKNAFIHTFIWSFWKTAGFRQKQVKDYTFLFIRVGSHLGRSILSHVQNHLLVIFSVHKVTRLLFTCEHELLLHDGSQLLVAHIHRFYWTLRGKEIAKHTVHKLMVCFQFNPTLDTIFMIPLPRERWYFFRVRRLRSYLHKKRESSCCAWKMFCYSIYLFCDQSFSLGIRL